MTDSVSDRRLNNLVHLCRTLAEAFEVEMEDSEGEFETLAFEVVGRPFHSRVRPNLG